MPNHYHIAAQAIDENNIELLKYILTPHIYGHQNLLNSLNSYIYLPKSLIQSIFNFLIFDQIQNINKRISFDDGFPKTLLTQCISVKNKDCLKLFFKIKKIDVNCKNQFISPLVVAIIQDEIETVNLLLDHPKININSPSCYSRTTPIMIAAGFQRVDIVKRLLKIKTLDLTSSTSGGQTVFKFVKNEEINHLLLTFKENNTKIGK
jgi:ankyrin repeat protein